LHHFSDVFLVREFGNETIDAVFTIPQMKARSKSELNDGAMDNMRNNEVDISEVRNSMQSGDTQSAAGNDNGSIAGEQDEEDESFFPICVGVTIEKVRSSGRASEL